MEEAEDEPLFCERAAGIDIGKQSVMVTVPVPSETRKGGRAQETRECGTTPRQLLELAGWLRSWGVTRAVARAMLAVPLWWMPEEQRRGEVGDLFSMVCPLSVATQPRSQCLTSANYDIPDSGAACRCDRSAF